MKNELKKTICEIFDLSGEMSFEQIETLILANPQEAVNCFKWYAERFNELSYALYKATKAYKVDR